MEGLRFFDASVNHHAEENLPSPYPSHGVDASPHHILVTASMGVIVFAAEQLRELTQGSLVPLGATFSRRHE